VTQTQNYQDTLFDDNAAAPTINPDAFAAATEHRLDEHSWITHVPGLLLGHRRLVDELATVGPWEQRQRWMFNRLVDEPRLTGEYTDLGSAPQLELLEASPKPDRGVRLRAESVRG
jgi:hypothetical protein